MTAGGTRSAGVIGAGFGGLALAIRLQAAGVATTLFEARDKPGGRAYVYHDAGFTFDAGPTVITDPDCLRKLWRREMTVKPPNTPPRWVVAKAGSTPVRAIVFAADRRGRNFVTGLSSEQIATVLCAAAGHWGSGAEYLMQTVDQLERLGIRDANLWRLQRLVAQQLLAMKAERPPAMS